MPDDASALSTAEVSRASGYAVQQIRDLEAAGVLSPVPRSANGYRRFDQRHVRDLEAYRALAFAVGPVVARATMRDVRVLPAAEASAAVAALHTGLSREREETLAARRALRVVQTESTVEAPGIETDAMTITELAEALDVRTSTLRFWERIGLLAPERVTRRGAPTRWYRLGEIRRARIIAALRAAGYRIPEVHEAIDAIRRLEDLDAPLQALDARVAAIAERMLALSRAGTAIAAIITER